MQPMANLGKLLHHPVLLLEYFPPQSKPLDVLYVRPFYLTVHVVTAVAQTRWKAGKVVHVETGDTSESSYVTAAY